MNCYIVFITHHFRICVRKNALALAMNLTDAKFLLR